MAYDPTPLVPSFPLSSEARRAIEQALSAAPMTGATRAAAFFLDEAIILTHGLGAERYRPTPDRQAA